MSKQINSTAICFFSLRSRDLFWSLTLASVVNLIALTLLSLGYQSMLMPLLVMVVLLNLFGLFIAFDTADDFSAMIKDLDSTEKESHVGRRLTETPMFIFKISVAIIYIGMAGSILYAAL